MFEYIYFARPDSDHGRRQHLPHHGFRQADYLAMDSPVEADLVVGVPESGNAAALGYSHGIRHSLRHGFCEERLCGPDLHQAQAEQPGIQRPCEAECIEARRWTESVSS